MNLSDQKIINADRDIVFAALLNPEVLKACVPGCQEMSGSPEEGFEATFKGQVQLSEMIAPESLTITGEGKGGAAGFAKGGANVRLEADGDKTILHYDVEAKVGGKLAQLGSRIIDGFAKKMADQFFSNFQDAVGAPSEEEEAAEVETADGETKKKGWFNKLVKG